jgi:hypothetical protein
MKSSISLRFLSVFMLAMLVQAGGELLALCCQFPGPLCADSSSSTACTIAGGTPQGGFCNSSTGLCEANPKTAPGMPSWAQGLVAVAIAASIPWLFRINRRVPPEGR